MKCSVRQLGEERGCKVDEKTELEVGRRNQKLYQFILEPRFNSYCIVGFPFKDRVHCGKFYHQVELGTHLPQTQEKFLSIESRFPALGPPNSVPIWRDSRKWRKQGSSGRSGHWEWAFESLFLVWYEVQNFLQLPFLALYVHPKYATRDGIF